MAKLGALNSLRGTTTADNTCQKSSRGCRNLNVGIGLIWMAMILMIIIMIAIGIIVIVVIVVVMAMVLDESIFFMAFTVATVKKVF
jgi:uncharacterized membrane protein